MNREKCLSLASLLLAGSSALAFAEADTVPWPQWRGPAGTGAAEGNPPVEWGEDHNIAWKVPLAGLGSSTPVVIGDRIYLTVAIDTGATPEGEVGDKDRSGRRPDNVHDWAVVAYELADGAEAWRSVVTSGLPHEGSHMHATWASNSPVTDGEHLYAYFGTQGLYALDLEGQVLWSRDFGTMNKRMAFGEGSSPALARSGLIVQWDHEGESFIAALDKDTGEERWRESRSEASSWSTPLVVEHNGREQAITNATNSIRSYDTATGEVLWSLGGMTDNVIPTPVHHDGVVYVMSGFMGAKLYAIDLARAAGDLEGSEAVLWSWDRDTPYVVSPLLYADTLYFFKVLNPIMTAFDATAGEPRWGPVRVEGLTNIYASPVGAAGRVYVVDRKGAAVVLTTGDDFEVLATNTLDDGFDASPVVVGDSLILRGRETLYRIAE
jgi:outer membrane protein assembly factor BamB